MKRDKLAKIFIFGALVVSINILTVSVRWDWPWSKGWKKNGPLVNGAVNETFASILTALSPVSTKGETHTHRTYLISQTRCTQKVFLLIMVFIAPANYDRRRVIRKTWATDPSMQIRWKTVFLIGQAVGDSIQNQYLDAEGEIHRDLIRGAQNEDYNNLTLKAQMGLEWAAKYCDFEFLLKADDDVFVDPYKVLDYLERPDTLKLNFTREVSSSKEYNKTTYPDFCAGPAYLLSSDLVHKLVDMFEVNKRPFKLEDVYIGMLVEKMGDVKAVLRPSFRHAVQCKLAPDTISHHSASVQCMEELFSLAMKEKVEYELVQLRSVKTVGRNNTLN